jgi:hypothetical protein
VAKNEEFRFKGREIIAKREEEVKVEKEKQVKELEEAEPVLPFQLSLGPSLIVFLVSSGISPQEQKL